MPEFSNPFQGNNLDRNLTKEELVRAVRYSIASEFEAMQLYEQLASCATNKTVQEVMQDIANEEKEHVGEFYKLIEILDKSEFKHYDEGKKEVEEKFLK